MAKIVIIDDDIAMDILAQRLRYAGHEVSRHTSLEDATAAFQGILGADLIFLDIIMPWPDTKPTLSFRARQLREWNFCVRFAKGTPLFLSSCTRPCRTVP